MRTPAIGDAVHMELPRNTGPLSVTAVEGDVVTCADDRYTVRARLAQLVWDDDAEHWTVTPWTGGEDAESPSR